MNQSTSDLLESTFRDALTRAFQAEVAAGALSIWLMNEDLVANPDSRRLPGIILAAIVKDWDLSFKFNGAYAEKCQLKVECRVAGNAPNSSRDVERLLVRVRSVIENPAQAPEGWTYLYLNHAGTEDGFKDGARVLSAVYEISALPLV